MFDQNLPSALSGHKSCNGRRLIGRHILLSTINESFIDAPATPLLLLGAPQIGKTTLLCHIAKNGLEIDTIPMLIDGADLVTNGLSGFWWNLANACMVELQRHHIELPPLAHISFVAAPYAAFCEQLLQPLINNSNGRLPLFLCDNSDALLNQLAAQTENNSNASGLIQELFDFFYNLQSGCLLAFEKDPANLTSEIEALFSHAQRCIMEPLSENETHEMITVYSSNHIVNDVAKYLHQLTDGHPAKTDVLLKRLHTQQTATDQKILTITDILAAYKSSTSANKYDTAVDEHMPTYHLSPTSTQRWAARRHNRRQLWLTALILISVVTVVGLLFIRNLSLNTPAVAFLPTPTNANIASTASPTPITVDAAPIQPTPNTVLVVPPASPTYTVSITIQPTITVTAVTTPSSTPVSLIIRPSDKMPMVYVPAATFPMGSEDDFFLAAPDEKPEHEVTLDAFYIDQFEVTVAQYSNFLNQLGTYQNACMGLDCTLPRERASGGSHLIEEDLGNGNVQFLPLTGYANYPINNISWYGAAAYCAHVGGRLPTEAEWEYAARGTDGRLYPWGNTPPGPNLAIFQSNFDALQAVDALPDGVSPFGVYGMAGSMWEWTADWYQENAYEQSGSLNPTGPEAGFARVLRGGGWPENNEADRIRTTNRHSMAPELFSSATGFRCVLTP